MAPLPSERVLKSDPFSVAGLDYTGAISVRRAGEVVVIGFLGIYLDCNFIHFNS